MTLGQKVKSQREELGLTQEELALAVGTSQSHISKLEKNLFFPSGRVAIKLASKLGISMDELFESERRAG